MKELTSNQKLIIKNICQTELMSLKSVFGKRVAPEWQETDNFEDEIFFSNDLMDNLLDSTNYFSKLQKQPDLIFEIDMWDAKIFLQVMNLLSEEGIISVEGTEMLTIYLREKIGEIESDEGSTSETDIKELIREGEGKTVEFKPALSYCFTKERATLGTNYIIAKAICSFLNSEGGVLVIGVSDTGEVTGLENDYSLYIGDDRKKKDLLRLAFDNLIHHFFDTSVYSLISTGIFKIDNREIFIVTVSPSEKHPVFLRNRDFNQESGKWDKVKKEFFIRGEASSLQVKDPEEMNGYIRDRWI